MTAIYSTSQDWETTATAGWEIPYVIPKYTLLNECINSTNIFRNRGYETNVTGGNYNYGNCDNLTTNVTGGNYRDYVTNVNVSGNWDYVEWFPPEIYGIQEKSNKIMQFAWKLKTNLNIVIKSRSFETGRFEPSERVAMETLREVISEVEFRKYLRYGFILVKGQSGDTYQIFRNKSHTKVWRNGKIVEEVCVRIKHDQNVPPTDNVIAFRQIIRTSEEEFKKLGNVYRKLAA